MRPLSIEEPGSRSRTPFDAAPYVAFVLGWLILAWPWLSGRVTIPWDAKAEFLPQIQFLADSLRRGESPFWNPFVFSGYPQLADPQSMIFSPPFLLLALVDGSPSAWAVDCTVLLSILVGGCALIAWFADRSWHPLGAVIAALAFGFGAAMAWRLQHTGQVLSLCMLPVTLLLLDRALARGSLWLGFASGVAGAILVIGRDQVALLAVYLLVAHVIWQLAIAPQPAAAVRRAVGPLIIVAITGLALIAVPVLLTAALAAQSNRPEISLLGAGQGSLHPASLLSAVIPDLFGASGLQGDFWGPPSLTWNDTGLYVAQNMGQVYVGAIPGLLIAIGLGSGVLLRREIVLYPAALMVFTLYALGWYTPFFQLAHWILPGVDLYRRPADAVFLMGFVAAVMAGYTVHALLADDRPLRSARLRRGLAVAAGSAATAFAVAFVIAVRMDHLVAAAKPLGLSLAAFVLAATVLADAVWLIPIRPRLAAALVVALTIGDLAIFNGPNSSTAAAPAAFEAVNPVTRNAMITQLKELTAAGASPTRRDRVELVGLGFVWPNASITHRLENVLGYNPVRLARYNQATGAEDTEGLAEQRRFAPMFPGFRCQLADLLGLRYIAVSVPLAKVDPAARPADFLLIATTPDGFIYENPRALPRAIFAARAAPADFDTILNTGTWPDADLANTVLLSPDDEKDSGLVATRGTGQVALTSYANTRVEISVDSTRGGFVELNDLWHPWWVATLDGQAVPVLRANVLFRAVRVPYGHHTVVFTFAPLAGLYADLSGRR